jgi:starch synthase
VFSHSKVIYTIGQTTFSNKIGPDFIEKAMIHSSLKEKDLEIFKDATNVAMFRGGATYADAITFGSADIDKKLVEEFSKVRGKKTLPYNQESDLTDYLQLYGDLANK